MSRPVPCSVCYARELVRHPYNRELGTQSRRRPLGSPNIFDRFEADALSS